MPGKQPVVAPACQAEIVDYFPFPSVICHFSLGGATVRQ
jgi:hypothetical protein